MGLTLDRALVMALDYGFSVLPVAGHDWVSEWVDEKTQEPRSTSLRKAPAYMNGQGPRRFSWKHLEKRIMTEAEIRRYFAKTPNVGIVFGAVSGNAECLDFDEAGVYEEWREVLAENGHEELVARLVIQSTQTAGHYQALYRCSEPVEGSQKVALRPATDEELAIKPHERAKGLIETRGEGGYAVVDPSEGYRVIQGDLSALPIVSGAERRLLLDAAAYFDKMPPEETITPKPRTGARDSSGLTPGDDFDLRGSWHEVLEPHGWQAVRQRGRLTAWLRPGKERGDNISAHTGLGNHGTDFLVVFSTNGWPLLPRPMKYGRFRAYCVLNYGGDSSEHQSKAAKELYAQGYGERAKPKERNADERPAVAAASVATTTEGDGTPAKPRTGRWTIMSPDDLLALPDKRMLVEGLIGEQDRWMIFGAPGCAKTFTVLNLLVMCAVGGTFAHTFDVPEPLKVAYCSSEGQFAFKRRFAACLAQYGLTTQDVRENMRFVADVPQFFDQDGERGVWGFVEQLEAEGFIPDLLVIDTLSTASLGSKEIDNSEAALVCDVASRVCKKLDCSTGFVHHSGWGTKKKKKDEEEEDERPRGASAFHGAMDVMISQRLDQETRSGTIRFFKGKDIEPFAPVPFDLEKAPEHKTAVVDFTRANPLMAEATTLGAILLAMDGDRGKVWWSAAELHEITKGTSIKAIHNTLYRKSFHGPGLTFEWDGNEKPKRYRLIKKGESQQVVTASHSENPVTTESHSEESQGSHSE